jgi:transposase-like protein
LTAFAWRAPLSKDAVSRLVGRLRENFAAWAKRDLGELRVRYIFLDGWYPRVRIGKRRVRVPALVTLGVCANGQRVMLDLRLAGVESEQAWLDAVRSLCARNLGASTRYTSDRTAYSTTGVAAFAGVPAFPEVKTLSGQAE